jgi:hypothetical protein
MRTTTVAVGVLRKLRMAYRKSVQNASIMPPFAD